jgi:ATP-dependent Lon protease
MRCSVQLGNERALTTIEAALQREAALVAVFTACTHTPVEPRTDQLYAIGTVGRILGLGRGSGSECFAIRLEGVARVRLSAWLQMDPFREAHCSVLVDSRENPAARELAAAIHAVARRLHEVSPGCVHAQRALARLAECTEPAELPGATADLLVHLPAHDRQAILETDRLSSRLEATLAALYARLGQLDPQARRELLQ